MKEITRRRRRRTRAHRRAAFSIATRSRMTIAFQRIKPDHAFAAGRDRLNRTTRCRRTGPRCPIVKTLQI